MNDGDIERLNAESAEKARLANEGIDRAKELAAKQPERLGIASTPPLGASFQNAKKATEPLEPPSIGNVPRMTSAVKEDEWLRSQQEAAAKLRRRLPSRLTQSEQGKGSEMIENEQPKPRYVPDGPEKRAMDAQKFNQDWTAEQARGQKAIDEIRAISAELRQEQAGTAQGQDIDRGVGLG